MNNIPGDLTFDSQHQQRSRHRRRDRAGGRHLNRVIAVKAADGRYPMTACPLLEADPLPGHSNALVLDDDARDRGLHPG